MMRRENCSVFLWGGAFRDFQFSHQALNAISCRLPLTEARLSKPNHNQPRDWALHSIEPSPCPPAKPPSATTWHAAQSLHQPSRARQPLQPNQPRLLESVSLGSAQTSFPNFHPTVLILSSRAIHSMKNTTHLRSAPFLLPVKQSQDLPCFPGDLVFSDHLTYPGLASLDLL